MIFNEEQSIFRNTVKEFAESALRPAIEEILETEQAPQELFLQASELGIVGVMYGEDTGGIGLGATELCIALEELAKVSPGFAQSVSSPMVAAIAFNASEELAARYAEDIIEGSKKLGLSLETGGASTLKVQKTAEGYVLNGIRYGVANVDADLLCVVSPAENGADLCLIVEKGAEGLLQGDIEHRLGMAGSNAGALTFADVVVPAADAVIVDGFGMSCLSALADAAIGLGGGEGLYARALEFCQLRSHEFKPVIKMNFTSHKLAELRAKLEMCQLAVYGAAAYADEYAATSNALVAQQWRVAAKSVKICATEIALDTSIISVRLHGGIGYHDPMVWRYLGDVQGTTTVNSSNDQQIEDLAVILGYRD